MNSQDLERLALSQAGGDTRKALRLLAMELEAQMAIVARLKNGTSAGYVRAKPNWPVRPPKQHPEPIE